MAKKGFYPNDKNPMWKGDSVKYRALHQWVERRLGKPQKCENPICFYPRKGSKYKGCRSGLLLAPKVYDWANISGEYKRKLDDWIRLCRSCHIKYDKTCMNPA